MPVLGIVVYAADKSARDDGRLRQPVPAVGEFVKAACVTYPRSRGRAPFEQLEVTYEFIAAGHVIPAEGDRPAQASPLLTMTDARRFSTRADCEAALPAVQATKASRQIWFEKDQPQHARTTPGEPSRPELLLIGLTGIPFFVIGWLLRRRQRRTSIAKRAAERP